MNWEDRSIQHRAIERLLGEHGPRALAKMSPEQLQDQLRGELSRQLTERHGSLQAEHLHRIQSELMGLGPLEPLLADSKVGDILVNGPEAIWYEREGRLYRSAQRFDDETHLMRIMDRLVSRGGRRIDESSPMADARLPDGSRVNAVVRPAAVDGPQLSIRRFVGGPRLLSDWVSAGSMTTEAAEMLGDLVRQRANLIISGGTGAGKTSLLNALSACIDRDERILTLEDAAELRLSQPHVVRLEARPPNLEGKGEITMRMLLRNALRMRPDRLIVGANSAADALVRLASMAAIALGQSHPEMLSSQIRAAVDVVLHLERNGDGKRQLCSIHRLQSQSTQQGAAASMQRLWPKPDGMSQHPYRSQVANAHRKPEPDGA
ncbi:MAG: CpaF family protein [Betaproteobacteria bacterium]|nr:CpaF family protein [Betaproteobacteria bacterium]